MSGDFRWIVTVQKEGKRYDILCKWLIDASGRSGVLSKLSDLALTWDIHDRLLCFYVVLESTDSEAFSTVEASETGWWYTTSLPGSKKLLCFFTDDDLPAARRARSGEGFTQLFQGTQAISNILMVVPSSLSFCSLHPSSSLLSLLFSLPSSQDPPLSSS
jgi:hypothetical protein